MTASDSPSPAPQAKPPKITYDDLYRRSTQYRYWSFTKSKLEDLRVLANKKGRKSTINKIESLDPQSEEAKIIKDRGVENFPLITTSEELDIITYYARKCQDLANFFRLPPQARSTAIMYLYKFYLVHSVMTYHPQHIMYTCLFLAAKVENSFIGIQNFSKAIPRTTPASILQYEYLILQTMRFSLRCHHPFQPVYGFSLDIQDLLPKVDRKRLSRSYDRTTHYIAESMFTDAPFLYTPPQIALACLWKSDDVLVERYLAKKLGLKKKQIHNEMEVIREEQNEENRAKTGGGDEPKQKNEATNTDSPQQRFDKLMMTIKKCTELLEKTHINPSVEQARQISSRIRFSLDPARYGRKLLKQLKATAEDLENANKKRPLDDSSSEQSKRQKN